ncbi:CpXC domain-containing protein [Candidatus Leptofilum sp.]|uniref:CpXC domain-containing protein n=1 Tax=Candidatus Leptofilum sp. TaxID=3241576 RepID=UPI003B5B0235
MHTQLTCPQCGTPYTAEVHQVVDSKRTPHLKQQLLNGQLNVAVCPQCGAGGQMATLMLFHDADHEMFMVHVPAELNLNQMQREQMIGQLTKQVMDEMPPEERRAYMFQPQLMLNWQTFMEKVLETEGITPEMIARQKKQSELLQTLITADKDVQDVLLQERADEIDETFFAMLQQFVDMASQLQDNQQMVKLTNLRARLMTETAVGQRMEQQQMALHKLSREAKQQDGLTPAMLAKHVVANQEQPHVVDALVMAGQGALQYEFFSHLTAEIEKAEKESDLKSASRLTAMRSDLLKLYEGMQEQSKNMLQEAMTTLDTILAAPNKEQALVENAEKVDEAFMSVLVARMNEAEQKEDMPQFQALNEIHGLIYAQMERTLPPHVQLLNQLVRSESPEEQIQLLDENADYVSDDLLKLIDQVMEQAGEQGQEDLNGRLQSVKTLIQARL